MLTDTLCTRCGLCCDGTLFGDVELTGQREATRLEILGLDVDADDADTELLALPCGALRGYPVQRFMRSGRSVVGRSNAGCCPERPARHAWSVRAGLSNTIAGARAQVQRVKTLLAGVEPRRGLRLPLRRARRRRDCRGADFSGWRPQAGRARGGSGRAQTHDPGRRSSADRLAGVDQHAGVEPPLRVEPALGGAHRVEGGRGVLHRQERLLDAADAVLRRDAAAARDQRRGELLVDRLGALQFALRSSAGC